MLDGAPQLGAIEARQVSYVIEAWNALAGDRSVGMIVGCIPFTSILIWAQWEGLDRDAIMILADVFQMLEAQRIERSESKRKLKS